MLAPVKDEQLDKMRAERKSPCPCGSGRKFKSCCYPGSVRERRVAIGAPVYALLLAISLATIGCGTMRTGQIDAETSAMIVRTVQDLAAAAQATQTGLAAVRTELETSNSDLADKVGDLQEDIEPVVAAVTQAGETIETSPLNRKDEDGNPLPTSPIELAVWAIPIIAAAFGAKKLEEKKRDKEDAQWEKEEALGKLSPEEHAKLRAMRLV